MARAHSKLQLHEVEWEREVGRLQDVQSRLLPSGLGPARVWISRSPLLWSLCLFWPRHSTPLADINQNSLPCASFPLPFLSGFYDQWALFFNTAEMMAACFCLSVHILNLHLFLILPAMWLMHLLVFSIDSWRIGICIIVMHTQKAHLVVSQAACF